MQTSNQAGFTLIEILVVLIILSITASIAVMSFGDFGHAKSIQAEASRFTQTLRLIRYHAVLEDTPYRLNFSQNGYQISRFNTSGQWQTVNTRHIKSCTFGEKTRVKQMLSLHKTGPAFIQPSGEVTPFILHFFKQNTTEVLASVIVKANGEAYVKH